MKKKAKIILIVFFAAIFVGFITVYSLIGQTKSNSNPYTFQGVDNGWTINKTEINIDVNKDRSATVVEKYTVNFIEPSYSLYRALPLSQGERYYDIKGSVAHKNSSVSVETGLLSDAGSSILLVYIDMPSRSTGVYDFELSYRVIPRTEFGNTNRFYMNVVGHGWTTKQLDVKVTVTFPSNINTDESAVFAGAWGSTEKLTDSYYNIDGNTITIEGFGVGAFKGVTVDLMFPKNTFDFYFDFYILVALVIGLALLVAIYLVKTFKAKSDSIVPTVNFYPPKDENGKEMTPLDVGYLIDNGTEPEDVTSMIYYFAAKGYLRINDEGGKKISLEKVADLPPTAQPYERTIFNAIFASGATATMKQMEKTFPRAVLSVTSEVKRKYAGKTFEKKNTSLAIAALVAVIAVAFIYIVVANFRILGSVFNLPLAVIFAPIVISGFGTYINYRYHKFAEKKRFGLFLAYGLLALIACIVCAIFIGGSAMGATERAVLLAFVMISAMIAPFLNKRTDYYTKRLNDILGFKNFLETTEKDKLEMMLASNPSYYYDILPYANVLGVSEIWQSKFKSLQVSAPTYYYSSNTSFIFDIMLFNAVFRSSTSSLSQSVKAANGKTNFGGKSGFGGFGGGGGGRGGGGFGGGGGGRR